MPRAPLAFILSRMFSRQGLGLIDIIIKICNYLLSNSAVCHSSLGTISHDRVSAGSGSGSHSLVDGNSYRVNEGLAEDYVCKLFVVNTIVSICIINLEKLLQIRLVYHHTNLGYCLLESREVDLPRVLEVEELERAQEECLLALVSRQLLRQFLSNLLFKPREMIYRVSLTACVLLPFVSINDKDMSTTK